MNAQKKEDTKNTNEKNWGERTEVKGKKGSTKDSWEEKPKRQETKREGEEDNVNANFEFRVCNLSEIKARFLWLTMHAAFFSQCPYTDAEWRRVVAVIFLLTSNYTRKRTARTKPSAWVREPPRRYFWYPCCISFLVAGTREITWSRDLPESRYSSSSPWFLAPVSMTRLRNGSVSKLSLISFILLFLFNNSRIDEHVKFYPRLWHNSSDKPKWRKN